MTQHDKHDLEKHKAAGTVNQRAVDAEGRCTICQRQVAPPTVSTETNDSV